MTPSLQGSPTRTKEAPSPHVTRLAPLDTNSVFQCLGKVKSVKSVNIPNSVKYQVNIVS